jgi:hypothetical protein
MKWNPGNIGFTNTPVSVAAVTTSALSGGGKRACALFLKP